MSKANDDLGMLPNAKKILYYLYQEVRVQSCRNWYPGTEPTYSKYGGLFTSTRNDNGHYFIFLVGRWRFCSILFEDVVPFLVTYSSLYLLTAD